MYNLSTNYILQELLLVSLAGTQLEIVTMTVLTLAMEHFVVKIRKLELIAQWAICSLFDS